MIETSSPVPTWIASPQSRTAVRAVCLAILGASIAAILVTTMRGPMKDDIAWLLYVASAWLHGSRLYVDIVEVNPPLIIWLCAVPVFLGEHLGIDPGWLAIPFFGLIILGCAAWASRILTRARAGFGDPVIVFALCGTVLMLIPNIDFGQREHLLIACALPYLAVVGRELMGETPGRWSTILAAIVAALGCALKPRYALAFGAVEIYCVTRGLRLLGPRTLAAALTLGLYGMAVLLLEPAFFREAIPMAVALYGASDVPLLDLMFDCRLLLLGLAAGAVLLATQPIRGPQGRIPAALFVFAVGATIVCFLQGKNWFYHRIPATTAALLCLISWAALRLRAEWRPGWFLLGPGVLATLVVAAFGLRTYEGMSREMGLAIRHQETTVVRLEALIRREKAHSYMAFTDWIGLGFPVVNETGVAWASRFDSMWALDGELSRAHDGQPPADYPVRRWITADFRRACPDIVVLDRRGSVDYVALLGQADPAFEALWRHYARIAAFSGLIVYRHQGGCSETAKVKG